MKNLFLILLLTLLASCGGGAGGGSSAAPTAPGGGVVTPTVYEYRLIVEGPQGATFASNSIANFSETDEAQLPYTATIGVSNSVDIAIFGRTAFWEIQNTSGATITAIITRDGVEVTREVLTNNGQVATLTDNI